jgi:hypothetical protein
MVLGLAVCIGLMGGVGAGEKDKEVTLKGKITCPKCELNVEKKCWTVIVVKKDKDDVVYYFDKETHKKYHKDICEEGKKGKVTGVVSKEGAKMLITVKKLEYD